jgi:hypothetical protein
MSDPIQTKLSQQESLNLKKLLKENQEDCEDNTEHIRKVRNSGPIRVDVETIETMKKTHATLRKENPDQFRDICAEKANFLFFNYTDIFNKLLKDELNLEIFYKFLWVLKMIEEERVDQHEASVGIGKLLKELYIDSALRRSENLDKQYEEEMKQNEAQHPTVESRAISWSQWKDAKERITAQVELSRKNA